MAGDEPIDGRRDGRACRDPLVGGDQWAEIRHEAHATLFGIEAAAVGLTRNRHLLDEDELRQLADALVSEVHHLHDLLDRPARPEPELSELVVAEVIDPVIECMRAAGIDIDVDVDPSLVVFGVASHTTQVIRALVTNAHDHAPGAPVSVRTELDGDHAVVVIEDRGPGMPADLRRSAFGRGVRGAGSDGSGLGLYIARQLMDAQDGSIHIESEPLIGTAVHLRYRRPARAERLHVVA